MKRLFFLIILFAFTIHYALASTSELIKDERDLSAFSSIEVTQGIEVYLRQDSVQKITVEADETILNSVITEVKGNTLKLSIDDKYKKLLFKNSVVVVYISTPQVSSISLSAASRLTGLTELQTDHLTVIVSSNSEVRIDHKISTQELTLTANSTGKFTSKAFSNANRAFITAASKAEISLNLDVETKIECSATSHGRISINGKANDAMLLATTNAELKMKGFEAKSVNAVAATWSVIQIAVKESLAATATNGATINYSGKPKSLNKESTTGGRIR